MLIHLALRKCFNFLISTRNSKQIYANQPAIFLLLGSSWFKFIFHIFSQSSEPNQHAHAQVHPGIFSSFEHNCLITHANRS